MIIKMKNGKGKNNITKGGNMVTEETFKRCIFMFAEIFRENLKGINQRLKLRDLKLDKIIDNLKNRR